MQKSFRSSTILTTVLALGTALYARTSIVGGHDISIKDAPWQLHLRVELGGGAAAGCGASWLGGSWVVCAAHCVEDATPANATIVGGITRLSEDKASLRIKVKRILVNPDNKGISRDISLLELEKPITAALAKPIRWVTAAEATAGITAPGVACMATGWGGVNRDVDMLDSLQAVQSKIYDSKQPYVIQWAGAGGNKAIGSCQGDSGGPLVVKDAAGNWVLAGISSYIESFCGDPTKPSSYSRVSAFDTWIRNTTAIATQVDTPEQNGVLLAGSNLRLRRASRMDISFANLAGVQVLRLDRLYDAGEYALPSADLPAGGYILRIRGSGFDLHQAITVRK